ncbi:MAG: hypothetical protein AB7G24_00955 [Novosphingobium sp.]
MTAPARLRPRELVAATRAVMAAGAENARIVMDFANARIEVIIGGAGDSLPAADEWTDEDI